jgi:hypothetical protein
MADPNSTTEAPTIEPTMSWQSVQDRSDPGGPATRPR